MNNVMLLPSEIFKPVGGYNNKYSVSNKGRVISYQKEKAIVLKHKVDTYGYCEVNLHNEGKSKMWKVHRLVCLAFLDNIENKPQVNHKDFNRQNNELENLEWATVKEDAQHRKVNNRFIQGEKHYCFGKYKGDSKSAKLILDTATGIFYDCVADAAIVVGQKYKTLVGKLNGRDKNNTSLKYV